MSVEHDLILPGVTRRGGRWAIFSAANPGFALALREVLGPEAEITAVERDRRACERLRRALAASPGAAVQCVQGEVARRQDLRELDGVVAASVLHFVPLESQQAALSVLASYLHSGGSLLLIEPEQKRGSLRVPNPLGFESFEYLAGQIGLRDVRRVAVVPTGWWSEAYTALGIRA
jgi:hypothetical protein